MAMKRIALATTLLCGPVTAWRGDFPHIDLTWPPAQVEQDTAITDSNEVADSTFACAHVPIPPDVERIDFPIIGGQLQFKFTKSEPVGPEIFWGIDIGVGQFNGDMTANMSNWFVLDYEYWNATWFNAESELYCTPLYDPLGNYEYNLTDKTHESPLFQTLPRDVDLEGMNATLGLEIFRLNDADMDAGMTECVYVRLTSDPKSWGACVESDSVTPTATSSGSGLGGTTAPTLPPTPSNPTVAPTHKSRSSSLVIGATVGAVVGTSLAVLIIAFAFIRRRRRARQVQDPTPMPPDGVDKDLKKKWKGKEKEFVVAKNTGNTKTKEKPSKKGDDAKDADSMSGGSSGASIHSEVPPSYADAIISGEKP